MPAYWCGRLRSCRSADTAHISSARLLVTQIVVKAVFDHSFPQGYIMAKVLSEQNCLRSEGTINWTDEQVLQPVSVFQLITQGVSCCRFHGHQVKVFLELEDEDGTTQVQPGVQDRGGEAGSGAWGKSGAGRPRSGRALDSFASWVREFAGDPREAFPGNDQMKPEQLEIERLAEAFVRTLK